MLRVFGPPEDRVRDIFHGSPAQNSPAQERKMRELEKKKAYAADLQAQMREREQQKQQERMERLGAPPGGQGSSFQSVNAVPTNFAAPQPPHMPSSMPADDPGPPAADWPGSSAYASNLPSYSMSAAQPPERPAYQQPQQPPNWQYPGPAAGMHPPASYTSSPNSYGSPMYAHSSAVEPPARSYQDQLGYSPGGWPGASMPQSMAQPPSYMSNYNPYAAPGGALGAQQGRQPYMAMSLAAQQDPYGATGLGYNPHGSSAAPGSYAPPPPAADSIGAAPPSWGPPPGSYSPSGAAGSVGNYNSNPYGASAAPAVERSGYAAASSRDRPAWDPSTATSGLGAPGAGPAVTNSPGGAAAKAKKDAYRLELEQQIRDKAARKAAEKTALAAEDARKAVEQAEYDPFGRGGAGAPLRNAAGQVVSNIRGGKQPVQHFDDHQQQYGQPSSYASAADQTSYAAPAAGEPSGYWGGTADAGPSQDRYQQQQQQQGFAGGGTAPAAAPGPPPILNFRSDKAYMTANEVEKRQRAQLELQRELAQQIEEKKRRKELEQKQAEEEQRREEQRLAAEQARLEAQFQQEQDKEKAKANAQEQKEQQVAGAWNAAKNAAENDRRKTMEERRRSHGQIKFEASAGNLQHQSSQQERSFMRQNSSQPDRQFQQQNSSSGGGSRSGAAAQFPPYPVPQQQDRQQMMLEALRLEEEKMRQMAAQEVERLRADMEAQAAALRNVVERQGGEVERLRAAAAAAEAERLAAKSELLQVKHDMMRRSQEMQHETLNTILADYGGGPVSRIAAAYCPSPIRRIELDLPPPASSLRRSMQMQQGTAAVPAAAAAAGSNGFAAAEVGGLPPPAERQQSAVDLLESMLQQGRQQQQQPAGQLQGQGSGFALDGMVQQQQQAPTTAAAGANNSWINGIAAHQAGNVRGSMLVSESTFIFPSGLPAEAPPPAAADDDLAAAAAAPPPSGGFGSTGQIPSSSSALDLGSHWGLWQQQPPKFQRHTSSAPGSSHGAATSRTGPFAAASQLKQSTSINRRSLVTPGGSDLTSVVDRNADRLQFLSSMPAPGDTEALDEFLAKFVSKTSQPNQQNIATPPSRLLSANGRDREQQHTVQLLQQPSSRSIPARYGGTAADPPSAALASGYPMGQGASALAQAADAAGNSNLYLGLADTLDQEVSRVGLGGGSAAAAAQQRLAAASAVEASDASMLGSSHWLSSAVHADL